MKGAAASPRSVPSTKSRALPCRSNQSSPSSARHPVLPPFGKAPGKSAAGARARASQSSGGHQTGAASGGMARLPAPGGQSEVVGWTMNSRHPQITPGTWDGIHKDHRAPASYVASCCTQGHLGAGPGPQPLNRILRYFAVSRGTSKGGRSSARITASGPISQMEPARSWPPAGGAHAPDISG